MRIRTYTQLRSIESFEDRYRYLALRGVVGEPTFGYDRYLNQQFYRSLEWKRLRDEVIVRDEGCDLAAFETPIFDRVIIHHMNPMTVGDITGGDDTILDPEFLICVSHRTHNAIHYGDERLLPKKYVERTAGDTRLWTRR